MRDLPDNAVVGLVQIIVVVCNAAAAAAALVHYRETRSEQRGRSNENTC